MTAKPILLYLHSLTDVAGVAGSTHTYLSVFNPANSGVVIAGVNSLVQPYSVGASAVDESFNLFRTSAASGGTLIASSAVNRFDPAHPDSVAEVRVGNPTVTTTGLVIGGTPPSVSAGLGTTVPLSVSAPPGSPFIIYPGTGICYQTANGDVDNRWNMSFFWVDFR